MNDEPKINAGEPDPDYPKNHDHAKKWCDIIMSKELHHIYVHVPDGIDPLRRSLQISFVPPIDAKTGKLSLNVSFHQPHSMYLSDVTQSFNLIYRHAEKFIKSHAGVVFEFPLFPASACEAANKAFLERLSPLERERVKKQYESILRPKERV